MAFMSLPHGPASIKTAGSGKRVYIIAYIVTATTTYPIFVKIASLHGNRNEEQPAVVTAEPITAPPMRSSAYLVLKNRSSGRDILRIALLSMGAPEGWSSIFTVTVERLCELFLRDEPELPLAPVAVVKRDAKRSLCGLPDEMWDESSSSSGGHSVTELMMHEWYLCAM